jgi:hypothetical protein
LAAHDVLSLVCADTAFGECLDHDPVMRLIVVKQAVGYHLMPQ